MDFAECIRDYRRDKSLTANSFGRMVGRDRLSIYNWEKGASLPNASALLKLAELGVITQEQALELIRGEAAA